MKIAEVIVEDRLDELNWKQGLASLGTAAALAGAPGHIDRTPQIPQQSVQQQVKQAPANQPAVAQQENPLDQVAPAKPEDIQRMLNTKLGKYIYTYLTHAGIRGTELAQFLGQSAHETQNFTKLRETGGRLDFKKYEPVFKKDKHGKTIIDPETRRPKDFNPISKALGNTQPGDGARYCGRGFLHLTGRWNYTAASKALGIDLVNHPELLETDPEVAAKVALWFWENRVKRRMTGTDYSDTPDVTRPINRNDAVEKRHSKFRGFVQSLDDKK